MYKTPKIVKRVRGPTGKRRLEKMGFELSFKSRQLIYGEDV